MSFHPLAPDLSGLKDDEIYNKITELNNKINMAYRLGSRDAMAQMQMLVNHYQGELSNRQRKQLEAMEEKSKGFNKIIDIK